MNIGCSELAADLVTAEAALDRVRQNLGGVMFDRQGAAARRLIRATPGCEIGCDACDLECSIVAGIVDELRRKFIAAGGDPSSMLRHDGVFYLQPKGHA